MNKKVGSMPISFDYIEVNKDYSRKQLATMWGYEGVEAISRGVVTPRDDNKIILFVTKEKRPKDTQYENELIGNVLLWDGPSDHFAEDRILRSRASLDEVHLFFRALHSESFSYCGQLTLYSCERNTDSPSRFVFRLKDRA